MRIRTNESGLSSAMSASLGYRVNLTGKLFAAALSSRLPVGMTTTQVGLLAWLAQHPGCSQREISAGTGIDTATLAEMLRRLDNRGVVQRELDPADARRTLVTLTDVDDPVLREAIGAAREVNALATTGMRPEEVDMLMDLLAQVQTNLTQRD